METHWALISAAGGNGVFKLAPSYLQLLVRREENSGMENIPDNQKLKEAIERKPRTTKVKIGVITKIPNEWKDLIDIFG